MTFEFGGDFEIGSIDESDRYDCSPEIENTNHFEVDLSLFRELWDAGIAEMVRSGENTNEYRHYVKSTKEPFRFLNIFYMLLRDRGLHIGLAESSIDLDDVEGFNVRVHPQHQILLRQIMREYYDIPTQFIRSVTNGNLNAFHLDPERGELAKQKQGIVAMYAHMGRTDISSAQVEELLKRGFLSSFLIQELHIEHLSEATRAKLDEYQLYSSPSYLATRQQNIEQYEALRQEGYLPLGSEELYGIVNGCMQSIFERNPEFDRELGQQEEGAD